MNINLLFFSKQDYWSRVMTKPGLAICIQHRPWWACISSSDIPRLGSLSSWEGCSYFNVIAQPGPHVFSLCWSFVFSSILRTPRNCLKATVKITRKNIAWANFHHSRHLSDHLVWNNQYLLWIWSLSLRRCHYTLSRVFFHTVFNIINSPSHILWGQYAKCHPEWMLGH